MRRIRRITDSLNRYFFPEATEGEVKRSDEVIFYGSQVLLGILAGIFLLLKMLLL